MIDHAGFTLVGLRYEERLKTLLARLDGYGQGAAHRADRAVEPEFADKSHLIEAVGLDNVGRLQEAHSQRQVEAASLLTYVGRR